MKCLLALLLVTGTACAGQPPQHPPDYTGFRAAAPSSILILPPRNGSSFEAADEFSRAILTMAVGSRGYYVYPTSAVDQRLERAGIGAAEAQAVDPRRLHALSGCDAVLSLKIDAWEEPAGWANHRLIDTHARLTGCESGEVFWERQRRALYRTEVPSSTPNSLQNSALGTLFFEFLDWLAADPEDFVAGRYLAEHFIHGFSGLPAGPYDPADYLADFDRYPSFPPDAPWRGVALLEPGQVPPEGATALGPVQGVSCALRPTADAQNEIARRDLRAQAAVLGADLVSNPTCRELPISATAFSVYFACRPPVITCDGEAFASAPRPLGLHSREDSGRKRP